MPRYFWLISDLADVFSQGAAGAAGLDGWRRRLEQRVYQTIGRCRLDQMFDIVVAYPDSRPAIEDVRQCLSRASLTAAFVASFGRAIRQRLLHAGPVQLASDRMQRLA